MSQIIADHAAMASRILIVDDDPVFTAMAEACLADAGYDVTLASDGVEALQLLDEEKFHLAVIDLSMPRIDGLRLIGLIRGAQRLGSLVIMVVSATEETSAFDEALMLGANAHQLKPVDWTTFAGRVTGLLTRASQ
jgi:CheY-like chemotaxis protein